MRGHWAGSTCGAGDGPATTRKGAWRSDQGALPFVRITRWMDETPHESRCYACRTVTPPQLLVDDALPGLCAECRRRSRAARERIARLFPRQFGPNYFDDSRIDPPVPKVRRRCNGCGLSGTLFGWTCWRREDGSEKGGVQGDAWAFCVSCESLYADPWRAAPPLQGPSFADSFRTENPGLGRHSSFLVLELVGLFFVSIVILAMLI